MILMLVDARSRCGSCSFSPCDKLNVQARIKDKPEERAHTERVGRSDPLPGAGSSDYAPSLGNGRASSRLR